MIIMKDEQDKNSGTDDYNLFKQEYATLEVAEQDAPSRQIPQPNNRQWRNRRQKILKGSLVILVAIAILGGMLLAIRATEKPISNITVNTQTLDNGTLNQLSDEAGGDVKQQLTISPETLFKNNVIIQGTAEVKQDMGIGGNLNVTGQANIQGTVAIDQDTTLRQGLTVGSDTAIGGNLNVTGSITAASLSVGNITISNINVSGDVSFAGHLIPGGATPRSRPSTAAAGGSVAISGNDTAGTVTINVGGGGTLAGELAIIDFSRAFTGTPKVQLTPVNTSASGLNYYATRSPSFFTVNTSNAPANGATYVFDYLVTQ